MSQVAVVAGILIALALLVGVVDREYPLLLEETIRDADQRKGDIAPEDLYGWECGWQR